MIIDRRSRKRLFSQPCADFEILAPFPEESGLAERPEGRQVDTRVYASAMTSPSLYFIMTVVDKQRQMILFEPDTRMLASFRKYIPRKIHLREQDRIVVEVKQVEPATPADAEPGQDA
jgi:hypothetical protein